MSETPAISVVIPVYNQEKYVGKCVRSVIKQSFRDIEIIIVNDGSKDQSLHICQRYAMKDQRISIIDKKNEGLAYARRDGFLKSKGDYVFFLDSDDYLAPNALEALFCIAKEKQSDVVVGSYDIVYDNWGILKKKPKRSRISNVEIPKNQIISLIAGYDGENDYLWDVHVWGRLYRRSCIVKADCDADYPLFPSDCRIEDSAFNLALAPFIGSIWISDAVLLHYRYGGCTCRDFPIIREGGAFFDNNVEFCCQNGCESVLPNVLFRYSIQLRRDVVCQLHYHVSSIEKIRNFIHQEMMERKIVLWGRQHVSLLPETLTSLPLIMSILNADVDAFYKIAKNRERFLQKHNYWKMGIVKIYQKVISGLTIL